MIMSADVVRWVTTEGRAGMALKICKENSEDSVSVRTTIQQDAVTEDEVTNRNTKISNKLNRGPGVTASKERNYNFTTKWKVSSPVST